MQSLNVRWCTNGTKHNAIVVRVVRVITHWWAWPWERSYHCLEKLVQNPNDNNNNDNNDDYNIILTIMIIITMIILIMIMTIVSVTICADVYCRCFMCLSVCPSNSNNIPAQIFHIYRYCNVMHCRSLFIWSSLTGFCMFHGNLKFSTIGLYLVWWIMLLRKPSKNFRSTVIQFLWGHLVTWTGGLSYCQNWQDHDI